jgi:putative N-acetyltransferase (TIGR04045 family)
VIGLDGGLMVPVAPQVPPADPAGLSGRHPRTPDPGPGVAIRRAEGTDRSAYHELRRLVFVDEQGLFSGHDLDEVDAAGDTVVLVATDPAGQVVGGVRVAPHRDDASGGWWTGSRLAVSPAHRRSRRVGASLVQAACALVEQAGALRFDATVQSASAGFFSSLGWETVRPVTLAGRPHLAMRWPITRAERLAAATKATLASLLAGLAPGGAGWVGDDGAPVAGTEVIAACDAILPSMVERDPEWAGWCAVLVNLNDLAAMGAAPVALLDALAAPTATVAHRIMSGLRRASVAYGVPIIGGHTQLGVPAALSVTALGTAPHPVPGGGGRPGDDIRLTADLGGDWRPGYRGGQWDSSSGRAPDELRRLLGTVSRLAPVAAKDVSMAGVVGTLGMMAEAAGCGAELVVGSVPRPTGVVLGDWLTCFPGFAMLTAHRPGDPAPASEVTAPATSSVCGRLVDGAGVSLVWPDGERTTGIGSTVTGLGPADPRR